MPEWRKCTSEDLPPHAVGADEYAEGLKIYGADVVFPTGKHLLVYTDEFGLTRLLEGDDRRSLFEKMVKNNSVIPRVHSTSTGIQ
jgi:hypothetical protein